MITNQNVNRAECATCGHIQYAEQGDHFTSGYLLNVVKFTADGTEEFTVFTCREAHAGKAIRIGATYDGEPTQTGSDGTGRSGTVAGTYDNNGNLNPNDAAFLDSLSKP